MSVDGVIFQSQSNLGIHYIAKDSVVHSKISGTTKSSDNITDSRFHVPILIFLGNNSNEQNCKNTFLIDH